MSENEQKKSIWDKIPLLQKIKNIKGIQYVLLGLFVVVLILMFMSSKKSNSQQVVSSSDITAESYAKYLEDKLSVILGNIAGAGNVSVMITLDGGMRYEYATESEEITTSNNVGENTTSKTTKTEEVVIVTINGKSTPLVIKESYPKIIGVVVVASGANKAQVKLNIMSAITALLDVSDSNIQILVGEA